MPTAPARMPWVDHLRTLVIVLVVHMHACVTYSHVGDWYIKSTNEPTLLEKVPFIVWQATLQSFFMGLLFFLSGYFAGGSLARKGAGSFLRERWFRLGLPALFYMLVIHPLIVRGLNPWNAKFPPATTYYLRYLTSGKWVGSSGPLWFAVALLIFCGGLVLWRMLRPTPQPGSAIVATSTPSTAVIFGFSAVLGIATFLVRLVQPIETSVLNMQLCFFPQYIAFFSVGVLAQRRGWLLPLAESRATRPLGLTTLALAGVLVGVGFLFREGGIPAFFGGWHPQALALAMWEQFSGVAISLLLLRVFSRRLNEEVPWLRWMGDRSFGVYLFHAPVLVALMMLYRALPQNVYFLIALLTITGLAISLLIADVARRVPGLRAIV